MIFYIVLIYFINWYITQIFLLLLLLYLLF